MFPPSAALAAEQKRKTTIPPSPPCGKICSYEWDKKEEGKYYPLLYKTVNCPNTLHRMTHSPYPVIRPPPRRPPPELLRNFTMDDQCQISKWKYYDDTKPSLRIFRYNENQFYSFLKLYNVTENNNNLAYRRIRPVVLALVAYKHFIHKKHVAVIGTQTPWAEALLLNLGASKVTTVEYRELVIADKRTTTITPYKLAEQFLSGYGDPFDTVFTFSSLEHSGLGRYGDPITPFGDLEATAQVWCAVKPDGHFILAVPVPGNRNQCSIWWNGARFYGAVRLQHLTANWRVLDEFITHIVYQQRIYVMQKVVLRVL